MLRADIPPGIPFNLSSSFGWLTITNLEINLTPDPPGPSVLSSDLEDSFTLSWLSPNPYQFLLSPQLDPLSSMDPHPQL